MRVFISYAFQDREWARNLAGRLAAEGHQVWYSDQEVLPGENWSIKSGEALENCEAMLVLLSARTSESRIVQREIEYALGSSSLEGRLIPILVDESAKIPWILREFQLLRLRGMEDAAIGLIVGILRRLSDKDPLVSNAEIGHGPVSTQGSVAAGEGGVAVRDFHMTLSFKE